MCMRASTFHPEFYISKVMRIEHQVHPIKFLKRVVKYSQIKIKERENTGSDILFRIPIADLAVISL